MCISAISDFLNFRSSRLRAIFLSTCTFVHTVEGTVCEMLEQVFEEMLVNLNRL